MASTHDRIPGSPPSLPRYQPLRLREEARRHIVVVQAGALAKIAAFIATLPAERDQSTLLVQGDLCATARAASFFPARDALERHLLAILDRAAIGLRLYVCGDEAFIWYIRRLACDAGLLPEEISAELDGAPRTVYCVHCSVSHVYDALPEVECASCGINLGVRQHFSRRVGAYLGVCADPDRPYQEPRA
ncbi:dimethylamine monooxygenase subunit DmmA family protein [Paraburkholderia lacunae]|uniref:dimethylamine monooxygenase subunit DmmA family protein n=1 Tax=Paraburkholderia lacunae TaxID=2211104 RepID=UPI000E0ED032|nr:dimethylamine monooxygenase subunit DmmA family protein [Paraburkholderia lacunae]